MWGFAVSLLYSPAVTNITPTHQQITNHLLLASPERKECTKRHQVRQHSENSLKDLWPLSYMQSRTTTRTCLLRNKRAIVERRCFQQAALCGTSSIIQQASSLLQKPFINIAWSDARELANETAIARLCQP